MNKRLFSVALLISALPMAVQAQANSIQLNSGDFISAKKLTRNGETIVSVRLSKSGKSKFKKLNQNSLNKEIHADIAGVVSDFTLREPIQGDGLEMGPYKTDQAAKVVNEINKK